MVSSAALVAGSVAGVVAQPVSNIAAGNSQRATRGNLIPSPRDLMSREDTKTGPGHALRNVAWADGLVQLRQPGCSRLSELLTSGRFAAADGRRVRELHSHVAVGHPCRNHSCAE